jgi:two-component system response regulator FixJ
MRDTVIAIVDDDEAVRGSLQLLLQSLGWQTTVFDSAEHFQSHLEGIGVPGCLLLDLDMPGMNGADLLEDLAVKRPSLPVVVISGLSDSPLAARARRSGALDVLSKPFDADVLKRSIERALSRGVQRSVQEGGLAAGA